MATLSRPSSRASVRSEAPVPPPKPPHLTLSLRRAEAKPRPRMPRWSRGASVIGDGEGGAVVESGGKKEDEDEGKGGSTLHARPKGREVSASLDLGGGTLSERGGSTLRPAGAPKTQGTRLSILFCTSVDNPLAGGGTVNTHQKVSSSTPSASPSLTPSSSVNATDGGGEDERGEGGTEEAEVTVLDITGPAVRAVSTHAFEGEEAFGELSFGKGVELEIEVADLGGNWSLGWVVEEGQAGRGLIPIGYYKVTTEDTATDLPPSAADPELSRPATPKTPPCQPDPSPPSSATPEPISPPLAPPTEASTSHFSVLNLFADAPPATVAPCTPTRDSNAAAWRAALAGELGLDSTPGTPRTPYSPRSIGSKVVVSGVEFEPTGPGLSGEMGSYFPPQGAPQERPGEAVAHENSGADSAAEEEHPKQHEPLPRQVTPEPGFSWSDLPTPQQVETAWTPPRHEGSSPEASPPEPSSAEKAWADGYGERRHLRGQSDSSANEADDLVPPLAPFTFVAGARLSLTDSRALMGFKDTDVQPHAQTSEAEVGAEAETESGGLLAKAAETIGRGYSSFLGVVADQRVGSGSESDKLPIEPRNNLEEWILCGDGALLRLSSLGEGPVFHIDTGPAWRPPVGRFTVHVHSPAKRHSLASGDYTVFQLTTVFDPPHVSPTEADFAHVQYHSVGSATTAAATATVDRRYSHFVQLHQLLQARYPVLGLPELPGKSFKGRSDPAFVEIRRRDLERWLARVGRHPALSTADELRSFLVEEDDRELERVLAGVKEGGGEGVGWFLSRVLHPDFNVDAEDAQEAGERFARYAKASELGGGARHVEQSVGLVRAGLSDYSSRYTGLARALTRLVAGQALPPVSLDHAALGEEAVGDPGEGGAEQQRQRARAWCLQNGQGAHTFKDEDDDGLSLAKAVQAAGEALAGVGELFDDQARTSLLPVQELLREASYPHSQNAVLLVTHRQLLAFQAQLASLPATPASAEALARADTCANLTAAELERAHAERQADLRQATEDLLDAQIAMHRGALEHLEFARAHFDPGAFEALSQTGPRLRSRLERGVDEVAPAPVPLAMPSDYGMPKGLLGRRLTDGVGGVLFGRRGADGAAVASGMAPVPTAGTVRQPSVAEILAAQERGEVVGWRGSYLDNGATCGTAAWL